MSAELEPAGVEGARLGNGIVVAQRIERATDTLPAGAQATVLGPDLVGRVALVTGASGYLGSAIARALAARGCDVAVHYHTDRSGAEATADAVGSLGRRALPLRADVTDADAVTALVREATAALGQLDILVNNAGTLADGLAVRMSDEAWELVLRTNLTSAFLCTRAALREMLRRRWGRIINISSLTGVTGNEGQANYAAAKAGLLGLTRAVAREVATRGITVNAVAPGYFGGPLVPAEVQGRARQVVPMCRLGEPRELAAAVAFLASPDAGYITGQCLVVDGGIHMG